MKVFYVNDTSRVPHVGCLAVSDAHRRMFAEIGTEIVAIHHVGQGEDLFCGDENLSVRRVLRSKWGQAIYSCDSLVVNGEGTIHHDGGLHLLAMLAAAQQLGKATYLINAVLQEISVFHRIFPALTGLVVREPQSGRIAEALGGNPLVLPDSCVKADFLGEAVEDFNGEIVVGDGHWERKDVGAALASFGEGRPHWYLQGEIRKEDWRHAVANLRTAKLYVTGRHHGIYLCALADIPFVALPSNTHKIESLIEWSGCRIPICKTVAEIRNAVDYALANPCEYDRFRKFLLYQRSCETVDVLRGFMSSKYTHVSNFPNWIWFRDRIKSNLQELLGLQK